MPIHHAVTVPSTERDGRQVPDPTGIPLDASKDAPSPDNPWLCVYADTIPGQSGLIRLLWDGQHFSLPSDLAADPEFGEVRFTYDPPLE